MRRLVIILVLTFCLICQVNLGFASEQASVPPDIQKILDRGTLIVALYNKDAPPFFMQDASGNLTGYDISLAKDLAEALGVKVKFERNADTYDGLLDEIANGNADLAISLLSITLPRALKVNFSTPYAHPSQAVLYNRLSAAQKHYSNVAKDIVNDPSITLGVLNKSSHVKYAQDNFPRAKIILYADSNQGMQDVRNNKLFCFYFNEVEIKNWLLKRQGANLYLNYQTVDNRRDPIGIAVAWQNMHLLTWVNWFLFVNEQNGVLAQLQQQYFHES